MVFSQYADVCAHCRNWLENKSEKLTAEQFAVIMDAQEEASKAGQHWRVIRDAQPEIWSRKPCEYCGNKKFGPRFRAIIIFNDEFYYKNLKSHYRALLTDLQPYGSCIIWLQAVSIEIYYHRQGQKDTPKAWGFKPSIFGQQVDRQDDCIDEICRQASTDALVRFGNVLSRYFGLLERQHAKMDRHKSPCNASEEVKGPKIP